MEAPWPNLDEAPPHTDGLEVRDFAYAPDGGLVFNADGDDVAGLYLLSADRTELRRLTENPVKDPVVSPDGKTIIYVDDTGDDGDELWSLDVASAAATRLADATDGVESLAHPAFVADGHRLVVAGGSYDDAVDDEGPPFTPTLLALDPNKPGHLEPIVVGDQRIISVSPM